MRDPITVKLSQPVQVLSETVTEITLRPARGKDLTEIGNPLQFAAATGAGDAAGNVNVEFNMPVMARMIARLGNLTTTAVEDMDAADFLAIAMQVASFLAPTQG